MTNFNVNKLLPYLVMANCIWYGAKYYGQAVKINMVTEKACTLALIVLTPLGLVNMVGCCASTYFQMLIFRGNFRRPLWACSTTLLIFATEFGVIICAVTNNNLKTCPDHMAFVPICLVAMINSAVFLLLILIILKRYALEQQDKHYLKCKEIQAQEVLFFELFCATKKQRRVLSPGKSGNCESTTFFEMDSTKKDN